MGGTIGPAGLIRIVAVQADPEVMCVAFDVLGRRAIGINDSYIDTPRWLAAVDHARRHLQHGVDVFIICGPDCSGECKQ